MESANRFVIWLKLLPKSMLRAYLKKIKMGKVQEERGELEKILEINNFAIIPPQSNWINNIFSTKGFFSHDTANVCTVSHITFYECTLIRPRI